MPLVIQGLAFSFTSLLESSLEISIHNMYLQTRLYGCGHLDNERFDSYRVKEGT